ncbi:MAG: MBL fold metallo-hydrolase, partial [Phycisphaerales bacterium]
IFFTHNHVDHTFGLDEVRRFNVLQQSPIDIFAEPHTMDHLRRVYQHIFDKAANINDSFVATLIPRTIDAQTSIELFGMRFVPLRLLHGNLPVLGFRVEAVSPLGAAGSPFPLAYCTDVSRIPPETYPRLQGLRTLVLDALRHRKHPTHLTLSDAQGIAERIGPERTYFTHMSHDMGHAATNAELPEGMRLAHDGLTLGG